MLAMVDENLIHCIRVQIKGEPWKEKKGWQGYFMTKNKLYSFCMLNLSRTFLLNVLAASYVAFCFTLAVVLAWGIKREYSVAVL